MMPDLPGYRVIEGETIKDYIATLAEGAAILTGHPEMVLLIEKVDSVIGCYQDVGAVNTRVFSDEALPYSSGAIAIADQNRLTDPETLFRCVGGQILASSDAAELAPCAHSYTLEQKDNAFHIIYVGSTQEICQTFCTHLDGCTGH
jgi:hypothetical protein